MRSLSRWWLWTVHKLTSRTLGKHSKSPWATLEPGPVHMDVEGWLLEAKDSVLVLAEEAAEGPKAAR